MKKRLLYFTLCFILPFVVFAQRDMVNEKGTTSCINTGTNSQYLIAIFSNYGVNHIRVSTDGGTIWTIIDGNIPEMLVRCCIFYPGDNTKAFIATEKGVWQTHLINSTATAWVRNTDFPDVVK